MRRILHRFLAFKTRMERARYSQWVRLNVPVFVGDINTKSNYQMQVVTCDSLLTFKMMYLRSMPALIGLALV